MTIPTGPSAGHGHNLLGPQPTLLPADPAATDRLDAGESPAAVAADHPTSSAAWATLAEQALDAGETIAAYAYARTGYHRGLDQLRRNGWAGFGPVPWEHVPNQGFLRAVAVLAKASATIGELDEATRCRDLLDDCDPAAAPALGVV
ncbi:DUF3151 domain-containing protein [Actinomycetospora corticicola]|uniref:DUF3151 domain-containing protein n=1 Tax=Actinomycetospora corticicola TaxID=663602 RepID=A0A7Y9DZ17_9PSEU|nr:DUF3151 domain-containing protein [Actinomycetospora corticicola]NYD38112.1 hypothetical protein [Actinomycetospora corticicola]